MLKLSITQTKISATTVLVEFDSNFSHWLDEYFETFLSEIMFTSGDGSTLMMVECVV